MSATIDVLFNERPFRGTTVNADGAGQAVTVTADDSGLLFINREDAGTVTYTLPASASCAGKWFWFINMADVDMTLTAGTVDTMVTKNNAAADSVTFTTDTELIGASALVVGDGTYVYVFAMGDCTMADGSG